MKTIAAALALLSVSLLAQIPNEQKSDGYLNGRFWLSLNQNERVHFAIGYVERWAWTETAADKAPPKTTYGELAAGITKVYEAPENGRLPIAIAVNAFELRVAGKPESVVVELLRKAREIYSTAP